MTTNQSRFLKHQRSIYNLDGSDIKIGDKFLCYDDNIINKMQVKKRMHKLNPDNEGNFLFGKNDIQELQEISIKVAEQRLKEEWSFYMGSYRRDELSKNIELSKRYLETAQEKKRDIVKIERCRQALQRNEWKLSEENLRLEALQQFIEYLPVQWMRIMIFEMEQTYIFEYELDAEGTGSLQLMQDSQLFDYLLEHAI